MKKLVIVLIFSLLAWNIHAQHIVESLEGVKCLEFNGGVAIYGFQAKDKGHDFKIVSYDKNLNPINTYSKAIEGDVVILWSRCTYVGSHFDIYIKTKSVSYFIKLSQKFEENSFVLVDETINAEDKKKFHEYGAIYPGMNPRETNNEGFYRNLENHQFINDDMLVVDPKEVSIIRYTPVVNLKVDTYYVKAWSTLVEGYKKIKLTGIIHADDKAIIVCLIGKGDEGWEECIVRLDPQTGKIKYKITPSFPIKDEKFLLSRAYFDPESERVIVVGQLQNSKLGKHKEHAVGILFYENGVLVSSNSKEFPLLNVDVPKRYNMEARSISVHSIGRIENGKYNIIVQNNCEKTVTTNNGTVKYQVPVAFSYFEINKMCNLTDEKISVFLEFDRRVRAAIAKGGEKFIYLECADDNSTLKTGYIRFDGTGIFQETETVKYKPESNLNFNPNFDVDVYQQYVSDDRHVISFFKFSKSNDYELKLIQIK
jgi:hypothetical protein